MTRPRPLLIPSAGAASTGGVPRMPLWHGPLAPFSRPVSCPRPLRACASHTLRRLQASRVAQPGRACLSPRTARRLHLSFFYRWPSLRQTCRPRLSVRRKVLRSQELPAARFCPQPGRKAMPPARRGRLRPPPRGGHGKVLRRHGAQLARTHGLPQVPAITLFPARRRPPRSASGPCLWVGCAERPTHVTAAHRRIRRHQTGRENSKNGEFVVDQKYRIAVFI